MSSVRFKEPVAQADVSSDASQKPSVLFITPTVPLLSGKGGSMRAGMHVLALSRLYEVHVVVLARFGREADLIPEPELAEKMASFQTIDVPVQASGDIKVALSNLDVLRQCFTRPQLASKFSQQDISTILKILGNNKFDLIFFGRLSIGTLKENNTFKKWVGNTARILDIDDIESKRAMREAKAIGARMGRVGHLRVLLDAVKLAFIERKIFKRFDQVLVCSENDQANMARRHPKTRFGVMPNGFRVPAMSSPRSEPETLTLLFVGFLQYLPNADGIQFFCEEVLPLIRLRLDRPFRLLVVGRKPPQNVLDLERIPEVSVIGEVPDVEPYYQSATIAIVPIRFGGGTRIKILEAMALGCPVVSTTLGAEGIEVTEDVNILLADSATEMADACIRLAEDGVLRTSVSRKAWETVNANYSADAVADRMAHCIRAIPDRMNGLASARGRL